MTECRPWMDNDMWNTGKAPNWMARRWRQGGWKEHELCLARMKLEVPLRQRMKQSSRPLDLWVLSSGEPSGIVSVVTEDMGAAMLSPRRDGTGGEQKRLKGDNPAKDGRVAGGTGGQRDT